MKRIETKHRSTPEKLGLHRETLRRLEPAELHQMGAAAQLQVGLSSPCGPSITTHP